MAGTHLNPLLGVGIGLRTCHYAEILSHLPDIPWFEAVTENYMAPGGAALSYLNRIREHYPIVFHGVGLSLGSTDPLNKQYLSRLKQLITDFNPHYISDHLCWTSFAGQYFHELLPLPYTEQAISHVAERICQVQDFLGQRILIENVSSYLSYQHSVMPEWEFINAIIERADCYLLLDINNIYVSACNLGLDSNQYLAAINQARVKQFHLGGFSDRKTHLLDTHGAEIHPQVWDLYAAALKHFGAVPTCIERDNDIPPFSELLREARLAQQFMHADL